MRLTRDRQPSGQDLLRATVLIPGARTVLVIGDSNLHAFGRQAGRLSDGKDYISGRISAAVRGSPLSAEAKTIWEQILARPQTDISSIDALSRILQSVGELAPLVTVKHAAEVRGADLQGSNVVIVGEPLSNP